jgi:hypothetical protein
MGILPMSCRAILAPLILMGASAHVTTNGTDRLVLFALMCVCVAEYNALLDGEVTPEEKVQVMGGNLLRLLNRSE